MNAGSRFIPVLILAALPAGARAEGCHFHPGLSRCGRAAWRTITETTPTRTACRSGSCKDPQPWWYGYSVGHWDGDTLVVETTGFRDDVWLDVEGSPLTSADRMTERIRRVDYGHLDIEITIDDPKAYTKPWAVSVGTSADTSVGAAGTSARATFSS